MSIEFILHLVLVLGVGVMVSVMGRGSRRLRMCEFSFIVRSLATILAELYQKMCKYALSLSSFMHIALQNDRVLERLPVFAQYPAL